MDAPTPKTILLTLMGSLGDVARGLTLVTPLKRKFPGSLLIWLVESKSAELVRSHPEIDRCIVFEREKGLSAAFAVLRELRGLQIDLCLDLQRHFKSGLFSKLSGAKKIVGFHPRNSKEFNWLFSDQKIAYCEDSLPKIEHYWKFLELLGTDIPSSAEVHLQFPQESDFLGRTGLPATKDYTVLVLASSWHSKDWPITGFHELLGEHLPLGKSSQIVLTGGKECFEVAEQLRASRPTLAFVNLCGKTSLSELCIIIKNAGMLVGPDSGPGHLAAMFNVPCVTLFGPTDPIRTAPYGRKVRIISATIGCSPCYRRTCPGLDKLCMRTISPKVVAQSMREIADV